MTIDADPHAFGKVTVFVLRRRATGVELLTFLHPLAGRQVPAGSVEQGESPAEAARREVTEETGLDTLSDLAAIGESLETLDGTAIALTDITLHDQAGTEADRIKRGHRVLIERREGARVLVRRIVHDFNVKPPVELPTPVGWAANADFATQIRRGFFRASAQDDGRLSWLWHADGHDFRVEWRPLDHSLSLVDGQSVWLAAHLGQLRGTVEGIAP
jgi:8-oxo-dGTP pyrophosphatase MutT (NUDIX family)